MNLRPRSDLALWNSARRLVGTNIHLIEETLSGETMNDATLWNSGKTARQDCYSVPFIHIQGIFYSWRDFGVYLSVLFFRTIMLCTVSENQSRIFRFPENHWVV